MGTSPRRPGHACLYRSRSSTLTPNEASEHLKRRFQIINFWGPIGIPALERPLALCDYRSVDPKNVVFPVTFIYPDRKVCPWNDS
ncbi:hypothetical protein AX15_006137 [Amanita polypyramis BW_CC]|nr:hypothetical protein AX15_006137 [Amanita polypyramis BW_CC]